MLTDHGNHLPQIAYSSLDKDFSNSIRPILQATTSSKALVCLRLIVSFKCNCDPHWNSCLFSQNNCLAVYIGRFYVASTQCLLHQVKVNFFFVAFFKSRDNFDSRLTAVEFESSVGVTFSDKNTEHNFLLVLTKFSACACRPNNPADSRRNNSRSIASRPRFTCFLPIIF